MTSGSRTRDPGNQQRRQDLSNRGQLLSFSPEEEVLVPDEQEEVGDDEQRRRDDEWPVVDAVAEFPPAGLRLVDLFHLEIVATKRPVSRGRPTLGWSRERRRVDKKFQNQKRSNRGFRFATSKVFLVLKMSGTKTILSIFFQVSSMSTFNQPNKKELAHSKQQQHSGLPGTQLKKCSGDKMAHEYINSILKIATESDFLLLDSTTACCASSGLLVTKVVKCFRKKYRKGQEGVATWWGKSVYLSLDQTLKLNFFFKLGVGGGDRKLFTCWERNDIYD